MEHATTPRLPALSPTRLLFPLTTISRPAVERLGFRPKSCFVRQKATPVNVERRPSWQAGPRPQTALARFQPCLRHFAFESGLAVLLNPWNRPRPRSFLTARGIDSKVDCSKGGQPSSYSRWLMYELNIVRGREIDGLGRDRGRERMGREGG